MRRSCLALLVGAVLASAPIPPALAQEPTSEEQRASAEAGLDVLEGTWVRPDGGYRIVIKDVGADGRLDAMYFNPTQLPFAKARASRDGATVRVDLELRAGGYGGSTYTLTYDAASDRLEGVYHQAVAKQKFDVYFARK